MKIRSINVVKPSDVPQVTRNTESAQMVDAIAQQLKTAKGAPLSLQVEGAKKYTRYALQRKLQRAGHKVSVRQQGSTFFVIPVS